MVLGELALIRSITRSPYPGMNEGWGGLDDDADGVVVVAAEPVK